MSRTDKDMPDWVTTELWEPEHYRCQHAMSGWWAMWQDRECDLPPTPVREHPSSWRRTWRARVGIHCHWEPEWTPRDRWHSREPRWFVEHVWHNPERRRLRDELRAAAAEWRATGDVENDPAGFQARHCAAWLWD